MRITRPEQWVSLAGDVEEYLGKVGLVLLLDVVEVMNSRRGVIHALSGVIHD